ncbi:MAG: gamma-glutamyl-phosphate reductase, partial [Croceibacterium sp.]
MSTQPVPSPDLTALVEQLALAGRAAQRELARLSAADKAAALRSAARALRSASAKVLASNAVDVAAGQAGGLSGAMLDRLKLDDARLTG